MHSAFKAGYSCHGECWRTRLARPPSPTGSRKQYSWKDYSCLRGRYCIASARWCVAISFVPSRSAIVRASFRMR